MTRWILLASLALTALSPAAAPAAQVANGGFETGTLAGWETRQAVGGGKWYAYEGTETPIKHERGALEVQPPPQGRHAAITDQLTDDTLLLFQDLQLEPGTRYKLGLLAYYDSYAALTTPSPDTLSTGEEAIGSQPNQQFRIDLVRPDAPLESIAPGDVLLNLFRTTPGGARGMQPTRFVGDLAPFAGQTVRLRIAVSATEEVLNAGVDAVELSAPDGTFQTSPQGRIRPGKARANPKKGTVLLSVRVPEAGRLAATSRNRKVKPASLRAAQAGVVLLRLRPSGKGRAILERKRKLRVGVTLTWSPLSGGKQKLRVPVLFRLRKP
ncbi:MAG TPA: hypothetical protein VD741_07175 [Solirubrobacterales bacterium]|nr:hypothetical protein [Solirubrobacterales bacterium]